MPGQIDTRRFTRSAEVIVILSKGRSNGGPPRSDVALFSLILGPKASGTLLSTSFLVETIRTLQTAAQQLKRGVTRGFASVEARG